MHPGDLAGGYSDLEMTWLLYCAGAATASGVHLSACLHAVRRFPSAAETVAIIIVLLFTAVLGSARRSQLDLVAQKQFEGTRCVLCSRYFRVNIHVRKYYRRITVRTYTC